MFSIGVIEYLNCWPLNFGLRERLPAARLVRGVPTELNAALLSGDVDVTPISAIEFARHCEELELAPGFSIATRGPVRSVCLFSRRATLEELAGLEVAVTASSATSVELLRLVLEARSRVPALLRVYTGTLLEALDRYPAALAIGDEALVWGTRGIEGVKVIDLGEQWLEMTRLPFVFAVWGCRRGRLRSLVETGVLEALGRSKADGLAHLPELAERAAGHLGLTPEVCLSYLRSLRYDLNSEDIAGLLRFLHMALPAHNFESLFAMAGGRL